MSGYEIVDVSDWPATKVETLGTKEKDWLAEGDDRRWLFKHIRRTSGDDWGEKAAAELAALIGVPHARVELARRTGAHGSISLDFTREGGKHRWSLVTGNELLWEEDPQYPKEAFRGVRDYTVDRVLDLLVRCDLAPQRMNDERRLSGPEVFVGYLLLDAWIANQDRHHENWGVLFPSESGSDDRPWLAPSYDHASCLGQSLPDSRREKRLRIHDKGHVSQWARTSRGALYGDELDDKPLLLLDAFGKASQRYASAAEYWLGRLSAVHPDAWMEILTRLPDERVSPLAREFAAEMLSLNRQALLELSLP